MIEYRVSREDERYFTWNGRHICSSYDLAKEAKKWVDDQAVPNQHIRSLVVLGLGAGYHLVELRKRYPSMDIVVFEAMSEFTSPCLDIHGIDFNNIEVVLAESEAIFKSQRRLIKLMQASYMVYRFFPVTQLKSELYDRYEELLIGRTPESLSFQVRTRKKLDGNYQNTVPVPNTHRLLDIRDLEASLISNADFSEVHAIKALRELIV